MSSTHHKTQIIVDGVELTVTQTDDVVMVKRKVGRDRKRKLDITSGSRFRLGDSADPIALQLINQLKSVTTFQTARCTCDYHYGWSDHDVHCQSIYVAKYDGGGLDDD